VIEFPPAALVVHAVSWNGDLHGVALERNSSKIELAPVRKIIESSFVGVPVLVDFEGKPDSVRLIRGRHGSLPSAIERLSQEGAWQSGQE